MAGQMQGHHMLRCASSQVHLNIKLDHALGTQKAAVLKVHMGFACSHESLCCWCLTLGVPPS